MFPSGHSDWPSGHITLLTGRAAILVTIGTSTSSLWHVPRSHMYPLGQQWTLSAQQTALGRGQQPHCPEEISQHVFPSGHCDWPSGHTTLLACRATTLATIGTWTFLLEHFPLETSHVYPLGQQWTPSEQQTALGRGQQPHCPEEISQHVFPSGHCDWPSGHSTLLACRAAILVTIGTWRLSLEHSPVETSHVYPLGQQWTPSEQQTASGTGQQPHCPEESLQHVFPSGHSDWPSGQTISGD